MNIFDLVDIDIPTTVDKVEFYTVDPTTLSFVKFGNEIIGTNNSGKLISLYVITTEDISELNISVQTSSNINAKIKTDRGIQSDFSGIQNNNTITINNILQNTPFRITMLLTIEMNTWSEGSLEFLWRYN
jgi:hypothetical protein